MNFNECKEIIVVGMLKGISEYWKNVSLKENGIPTSPMKNCSWHNSVRDVYCLDCESVSTVYGDRVGFSVNKEGDSSYFREESKEECSACEGKNFAYISLSDMNEFRKIFGEEASHRLISGVDNGFRQVPSSFCSSYLDESFVPWFKMDHLDRIDDIKNLFFIQDKINYIQQNIAVEREVISHLEGFLK